MSGSILVAIAIGVVFVILCIGLYTLWAGGDVSRTYSNKLMRLRVVMQAVAIVVLVAAVWWRSQA